MDSVLLLYGLLFAVALLYASVGHGGASGYLALMAVFGVAPMLMKPTALLLNIFVSLLAFIQFYRAGHFSWKIFLPFAIASIPFAFLGGLITIDALLYKKVLGGLLLVPVIRFLFFDNSTASKSREASFKWSLVIGAAIGFLSGLIGIGGGIILTPVLLLLQWTDIKKAAGISALFIFVNSISGLAGQFTKGIQLNQWMLSWVAVAFCGGLLGAYLGALQFKKQLLLKLLAIVLMMAAFKLLFTNA